MAEAHDHKSYMNFLLDKLRGQQVEGAFCDVTLQIEEHAFRLHKCVLAANSPLFESLLSNLEDPNPSHLLLSNVCIEGFEQLVDYMYTGHLNLSDVSPDVVLNVAQTLQISEAEALCRQFIEGQGHLDLKSEQPTLKRLASCSQRDQACQTEETSGAVSRGEDHRVDQGDEITVSQPPDGAGDRKGETSLPQDGTVDEEKEKTPSTTIKLSSKPQDSAGDRSGIRIKDRQDSDSPLNDTVENVPDVNDQMDVTAKQVRSCGSGNVSDKVSDKSTDRSTRFTRGKRQANVSKDDVRGRKANSVKRKRSPPARPLKDHQSQDVQIVASADEPYKCSECSLSFVSRSKLRLHASSHTSKPFRCDICGQGFSKLYFLELHTENAHPKKSKHSTGDSDTENNEGEVKTVKSEPDESVSPVKRRGRGRPLKYPRTVDKDKCDAKTCQPTDTSAKEFAVNNVSEMEMKEESDKTTSETRSRSSKSVATKPIAKNCKSFKSRDIPKKQASSQSRKHHQKSDYKDVVCKKAAQSRSARNHHLSKTHIRRHSLVFKCQNCRRHFIHEQSLLNHMKTVHPENCNKENGDVLNCSSEPPGDHSYNLFDGKSHSPQKSANSATILHKRRKKVMIKRKKKSTFSFTSLQKYKNFTKRTYVCKTCTKSFDNFQTYKLHVSENHEKEMVVCTCCKQLFTLKSLFLNHVCKGTIFCEVCNRKFLTFNHYRRHLMIHKDETDITQILPKPVRVKNNKKTRSFECVLCELLLSSKKEFMTHMKQHRITATDVLDKPYDCYQCSLCDQKIKSLSYLQRHVRSHKRGKPFSCDLCGKAFMSHSNMRRHIRFVHQGLRPWACDVCGRGYTTKDALFDHKTKHSNEKPFQCPVCKESFSNRLMRRKHVTTVHAKVKPTKKKRQSACPHCEEVFENRTAMRKHKREVHESGSYECATCGKVIVSYKRYVVHLQYHRRNTQKFVCEVCGAEYTSKCGLKSHMRKHTGDRPFVCEICNRRFHISSSLIEHRKTHSDAKNIICKVCGERFRFKSSLRAHSRKHMTVKEHKCSTCEKSFHFLLDLRRHETTHRSERPHECSVCRRTFKSRKHLIRHFQTHNESLYLKCQLCPRKCLDKEELEKHLDLKHNAEMVMINEEELQSQLNIPEGREQSEEMCFYKIEEEPQNPHNDTVSMKRQDSKIAEKGELVQQEAVQIVQSSDGVQIVQSADASSLQIMQSAEALQIMQQTEGLHIVEDTEAIRLLQEAVQIYQGEAEAGAVQEGVQYVAADDQNVEYVVVQYEVGEETFSATDQS